LGQARPKRFDPTQKLSYPETVKGQLTTVLNRERAERRHLLGVGLTMTMLQKIGRLFVIKTRLEAFLLPMPLPRRH
jgi:hypothetical protein